MLGADYPLLEVFLTMLWFFAFILWFTVVIAVIIDIFGSHDLSGIGKAGWFIFVLLLPLIGVLTYLIVRGHRMSEHALANAKKQDQAMREYVQSASGTSTADELEKLASLRDRGVITPDEFAAQKAALLGT